jgi:hypothetical protein
LDEQLAAISHSRQARTRATQNVSIEGWNSVPTDGTVHFTHGLARSKHIMFNINHNSSLLDIFMHYLPLAFVTQIVNDINPNVWIRGGKRIISKLSYVYQTMAIYIWLVGSQIRSPIGTNHDVLSQAIQVARNALGKEKTPGIDIVKRIIANVHITHSYFPQLNQHFCAIVRELGEFVAGDEKLLHFTGDSIFIRKVVRIIPKSVGSGSSHWDKVLFVKCFH